MTFFFKLYFGNTTPGHCLHLATKGRTTQLNFFMLGDCSFH